MVAWIMGGEWGGESRTNHPDFAWWPTSKPESSQAVTIAGTSEERCTAKVPSFNCGTFFVRARSKAPNTTVTVTAKKLK